MGCVQYAVRRRESFDCSRKLCCELGAMFVSSPAVMIVVILWTFELIREGGVRVEIGSMRIAARRNGSGACSRTSSAVQPEYTPHITLSGRGTHGYPSNYNNIGLEALR